MRTLLLSLVISLSASPGFGDNWPAWRGADGSGSARERNLPLQWSATDNIQWKIDLPEPGNSTPIVWDDRVFLTQALDGGKRRAILALDRATGKKLWQHEHPCDVAETTHRQNPPCSGSPVTDGTLVFAHFASAGVAAYSLDGKLAWRRELGPVLHRWGNGGSPILYQNLLILFHGPGEPSFLIALDRKTGATVWKVDEVGINSNIFGSWSTPVIVRVGERDELIMPLPGEKIGGVGWFKAYDPSSGKLLWQCDGLGNEIYAMPVIDRDGGLIVGISGHNGPSMAVRPGGTGDVTGSHRLWHHDTNLPQRIGTAVIHEGHLYLPNATGVMECRVASTGELVWKERLGGNLWGSVLEAGGNLYVTNLEGETFVIKASPRFELVAKNSVGEPTYAALAASDGQLFLRTHQRLYCIGKRNGLRQ